MPHHNPTPQSPLNMHKNCMSWLYVCMCPLVWFVIMIKLLYTTFYLLMWIFSLVCSLIVFFLYRLCNLCCYLLETNHLLCQRIKRFVFFPPLSLCFHLFIIFDFLVFDLWPLVATKLNLVCAWFLRCLVLLFSIGLTLVAEVVD
jgi:hypothetical protein